MRWWSIYALLDPDTSEVRYVGYTHRTVSDRLKYHVWDSKRKHYRNGNTRKAQWIRGLTRQCKLPGVAVLQIGRGDYGSAERFWIASFQNAGTVLLNMTIGGRGRKVQ